MQLRVETSWTYIESHYPRNFLDPVTSFKKKGFWFNPAWKKGFSDGSTRLVEYDASLQQHKFPTGLLKSVLEFLDSRNWHYTVTDNREFEAAEGLVLSLKDRQVGEIRIDEGKYSYQSEALQAAIAAGRGVIRIGTGGGKTEVAAALLASLGCQSVFLVHRENLLYQARERIEHRLGQRIGILGDGEQDLQKITVAMVQTVNNILKAPEKRAEAWHWLMHCKGLLGDEIHHVDGGSQTWYHSLLSIPASWRFGLSATPKFTGEGLYLLAVTGPVLYSMPSEELLKRGVLVPPRIWFAKCDEPKLPKKTPWSTVYSKAVVSNYARNTKIADITKILSKDGRPPLILVKRLNHGENILDCLRFQHLEAGWIHGKIERSDRDKILEKLWSGKLDAVVAQVETLGEGTDLPPLKAVINATASRGGGDATDDGSGRATIQILGRGLRTFPGKTHCEYVDFFDNSHKSLIESSKDRVNTLEAEGYGPYIRFWQDYPMDGQSGGGAETRANSSAGVSTSL